MNKIRYLFGLILFVLCVSDVNALTYDLGTQVTNISNNVHEIRVSLKDISDTSYGIAGCSLNISLSDGVEFNGSVRSLGGWSMTLGNVYLFDTGTPALSNNEFFLIPVKLSSNGIVTIDNINCSDDTEEVSISKKIINLTYKVDAPSTNNNSDNNNSNGNNNTNNENITNNDSGNNNAKSSNCDLADIILSEGTIDFDSSVLEYSFEVSDFDKLEVKPVLADENAKYEMTLDENNTIIINVVAEDETNKVYTLYIEEVIEDKNSKDNKNKYVPIFMGIICVLVLINIIRVAKKFV